MKNQQLQPRLVRDLAELPPETLAELSGLVAAIEAAGKETARHG